MLIDFEEAVLNKEQLNSMIKSFVPTVLKPEVWPGFTGVELVSPSWMERKLADEFGIGQDGAVYTSILLDMADYFRSANRTPKNEVMWVIFVKSGESWAYTYLCLLADIVNVVRATTEGVDRIQEKNHAVDSMREAVGLCFKLFPSNYGEIIKVAKSSLERLRKS